jgi:MFS family permease
MAYATPTGSNPQRLLWAGFFSIFAAGVGFGVRGRILAIWAGEYGFTQKELGDISGGGLWGFGLIIIAGSLIADKVGYGKLMICAFLMHVLSAVLQMCTDPIHVEFGRDGVYLSLSIAMVMFAIGNGLCEVVVNPMVATLFPREKTHYLNILHAGWPGGLIAGGVVGYVMNDIIPLPWIVQMSMFLVPVAIYGAMLVGQRLPRSEAGEAGVSYGRMLLQFASPILLILLLIHAMVGYVELGTDSWIQKITGTITASAGAGVLLFIYTNILMFTLRFFAGPIEYRISPLGLLFSCAVIAAVGLLMLGNAVGVIGCLVAVTIYGIGKTFFWPTMLAVVSERFPRGGALTLGAVGGIGMLSAGFLGSPGLGFKQDHYATSELSQKAPDTYRRYAVADEKVFLGVLKTRGLDGAKVYLLEQAAKKNTQELSTALEKLRQSKDPAQQELLRWWEENQEYVQRDYEPIETATLYGSRMALIWTALVPTAMAVLYLLLILYFKARGGYKAELLTEGRLPPEKYTGGIEGPVQ